MNMMNGGSAQRWGADVQARMGATGQQQQQACSTTKKQASLSDTLLNLPLRQKKSDAGRVKVRRLYGLPRMLESSRARSELMLR